MFLALQDFEFKVKWWRIVLELLLQQDRRSPCQPTEGEKQSSENGGKVIVQAVKGEDEHHCPINEPMELSPRRANRVSSTPASINPIINVVHYAA
ncbi:hypothetical protein SAMN00790413_05520 [Deinococcus hopiensis KR-140]|uniref:Uncharacterized protein n=1 Tax=Deinococcus hopiensis KR-140 TaxID=695939 RepID=A0A1W1UI19_9DEIO|nr:hypothetical protein SAMN00790413_05520 [Deinococcus hopiensis KR-140]